LNTFTCVVAATWTLSQPLAAPPCNEGEGKRGGQENKNRFYMAVIIIEGYQEYGIKHEKKHGGDDQPRFKKKVSFRLGQRSRSLPSLWYLREDAKKKKKLLGAADGGGKRTVATQNRKRAVAKKTRTQNDDCLKKKASVLKALLMEPGGDRAHGPGTRSRGGLGTTKGKEEKTLKKNRRPEETKRRRHRRGEIAAARGGKKGFSKGEERRGKRKKKDDH